MDPNFLKISFCSKIANVEKKFLGQKKKKSRFLPSKVSKNIFFDPRSKKNAFEKKSSFGGFFDQKSERPFYRAPDFTCAFFEEALLKFFFGIEKKISEVENLKIGQNPPREQPDPFLTPPDRQRKIRLRRKVDLDFFGKGGGGGFVL